jgi:predicted RNA binding protein with dsRBD fold (UPF0201 family)/dephospho-CoA kinase
LLVIGFVGFPGSGKTEAALISQVEGFFPVAMGDAVRSYMCERDIELTERNVGEIANKLRAERGTDAIAKMCIPVVRALSSKKKVVIDGIRGIAEVNAYRAEFKNDFKLIAISASSQIRFERVRGRSRSDDVSSFSCFEEKDARELTWGLKEAINAAEFNISNEGTLEELRFSVSNVLKQMSRAAQLTGVNISIKTPIYETEDQEKVESAIRNIFPDAILGRSESCILGTSTTLETFASLLKVQRIRTAAKTELTKRLTSSSFEFILNKQVALVGKVNFSQDLLGPIFVRVLASLPDTIIDAVTDESVA